MHSTPFVFLRGENWPRCTGCGHRVTVGGRVPVQTRYRPPWMWPVELVNRFRAKRRKEHETAEEAEEAEAVAD
jgi:DNA-directed RNA polymerase subunit RPC12/RpoP